MRVGVDATCWQNTRGYGRHARALLTTLVGLDKDNGYTFFMDSPQQLETVPREVEVRLVRASAPAAVAASANGHRSPLDMCKMSRAMSNREFDLLLFPSIYSYIPVFSRAKKVVMIHDVIAEKYPDLTVPRNTARFFWKTKVTLGRWQADAIVTVSDYSHKGIVEHFGLNPDSVFIVGEASDPIFGVLNDPTPTPHLKTLGLDGRHHYVVYVGGFSPHKNLEALVWAFAKLAVQQEFSNVRLVMIGDYEREVFHSYFATIRRQVLELGLEDRVVFTGYLPDAELVALLNVSTALVLPSFMEGFGLPAIEAAACGCPVIATRESPLPCLLGDGGIYVNPNKREDLELALTKVLASEALRQRMRTAGLAASRRLSWESAARQMIGVMQKVVMQ